MYLDNAKFGPLNDTLDAIGRKYGVSKAAVGVAWILRHPAKTQVIVGTTNPERLKAMCKGSEVVLTREEWYEIYRAAGHKIPDHKPPFRGLSRSEANKYSGRLAVLFYGS